MGQSLLPPCRIGLMLIQFFPSTLIRQDACDEAKALTHLGKEGVPSEHGVIPAYIRPYPHPYKVLKVIDSVLEYQVKAALQKPLDKPPYLTFLLIFPIVGDFSPISAWPDHDEVLPSSVPMWAERHNEGLRWTPCKADCVDHASSSLNVHRKPPGRRCKRCLYPLPHLFHRVRAYYYLPRRPSNLREGTLSSSLH